MRAIIRKRVMRGQSVALSFDECFQAGLERMRGSRWPSTKWANDPVGFVREALGEAPLPHQVEILEAARDNFKVAVRSGQKTGKTKLVVWLALWWYCTKPGGRVFMIAAIKEQVERVLWVEVKATLRVAKRCAACRVLDPAALEVCAHGFELIEKVPANPGAGIISADGREMRGFTVRDIEAMAGLSGEILFIVDEASHLLQKIAEAIEGNLAGGGRMIWISNPTRTEGPFFDVFNNPDKGKYWRLFHLSSEDVAKYCAAHGLKIPGVATLQRIAEWAEEMGRDSPFFIVRVLGQFLKNEAGRIITLADIELAQKAWEDARDDAGTLQLGVDPAGPGDGGDEFAISLARGAKQIALHVWPGLSEDAAEEHIRGLVKTHRRGDEVPNVVIDAEGPIGSGLYQRMKAIGAALLIKRPADAFTVWGVKASHNARREPLLYERVREELWSNAAKWLREGGAILPDHKQATELHAPMWIGTVGGRLKVTPKDDLRKALGRSPDRADAFNLSVWPVVAAEVPLSPELPEENQGITAGSTGAGFNPYAGLEGARGSRGGGFDPYA